jgi:hypothetical protein
MNANVEPQLAPPGAGLPKLELLIARLLFSWRRRRGSRAIFDKRFCQEREAIVEMARVCSDEAASRRVLIPRVRGMEDSSRYWSVWMTLDHLRIVNNRMARVIQALSNGTVPQGKSSTAGVKPSPAADKSALLDFEKSCESLLATVAAIPDLRTPARFAHPWFGPLDAAGWHALAGGHMAIHRLQIERILATGSNVTIGFHSSPRPGTAHVAIFS